MFNTTYKDIKPGTYLQNTGKVYTLTSCRFIYDENAQYVFVDNGSDGGGVEGGLGGGCIGGGNVGAYGVGGLREVLAQSAIVTRMSSDLKTCLRLSLMSLFPRFDRTHRR